MCRYSFVGLKILKIENLILTKDQNESIDFTDNDIVSDDLNSVQLLLMQGSIFNLLTMRQI